MEIIEKNEQSLLSRTEIVAKDSYTGSTPSRESIKDRLAKTLNANKELLVIKHIYTEFGFGTAKVIAYLYSTKENMKKIEPEHSLKRGEKKKQEGKEEPKQGSKKEEKKPEETKKSAENKEQKPEDKKQGNQAEKKEQKNEDNKKPDRK
jgi:small subunit ribosomal protein S24e